MLSGVRIYSANPVWKQILADFGATVLDVPSVTDVNFDNLNVNKIISPMELKTIILNATDNTNLLFQIFGEKISLPRTQEQIIVMLYKSGGMTLGELKNALGYAPNVATHVVDTAISGLRRVYGREFIINNNGVYKIGKL